MDNAFDYVKGHPLEREEDYPYTASDGVRTYDSSKGVGKVYSYVDVTPDSPN